MQNDDKKIAILIVDDEAVILSSIAYNLTREGFDVVTAASGEEALPLLQERVFDLVLTDLALPNMSGIEVAKAIKSKDPETGVIVFTGYGALSTAIEALRLGADDYMLKPCEMDELLLRIDNCLKKRAHSLELRRYKQIIATIPDRVTMISPDHIHLIANQSYADSICMEPDAVIGSRVEDVFGEEFFNTKMADCLQDGFSGKSVQHQNSWNYGDQPPSFLHFSYSPFRTDDDKVSAVILNIRDLTDYQEISQELEEGAKRLRLALDVSSDGVWD